MTHVSVTRFVALAVVVVSTPTLAQSARAVPLLVGSGPVTAFDTGSETRQTRRHSRHRTSTSRK